MKKKRVITSRKSNLTAPTVSNLMLTSFSFGLLYFCFGCSQSPLTVKNHVPNQTDASFSVVFRDSTTDVHLKHYYENGEDANEYAILETIGGGVASADFDRDGFDDLYFASGGQLNNKQVTGLGGALWRNRDGKEFQDITALAGVSCPNIYTHGTTSGDLNNDGFADLLVTGYKGIALFINQGDGTFIELAQVAGMNEPKWGTSSAFGDFDNDGDLDIYIAHYVSWSFENHPSCQSQGVRDVCAPGSFTGVSDVVYLNSGDGLFTQESEEIGLVGEGKGLGVLVADFTQDSKVDIYVANDTTNNFFYQNQGGSFNEIGMASGTAVDDMGTPQGSMGLCSLDYDGDLYPDILVCNYESQAFALYKNDGDSNFRHVTSATGLMALGTMCVAWGSAATDFDLDGDEDLVIANGHVMRAKPPEQLPLYLHNLGNKKFAKQKFPDSSYFSKNWRGRGVVPFDMDHDGDIDLVFTHVNQDAVFLENRSEVVGNWWILELVGTKSNRDAIGARVVITSDKRTILRNVTGGGSYLSQKPYYIHWGLPAEEILKQVEITWPNGLKEVQRDLPPGSRRLVIEPS